METTLIETAKARLRHALAHGPREAVEMERAALLETMAEEATARTGGAVCES